MRWYIGRDLFMPVILEETGFLFILKYVGFPITQTMYFRTYPAVYLSMSKGKRVPFQKMSGTWQDKGAEVE